MSTQQAILADALRPAEAMSPSDPYRRAEQTFPRLNADQVARASAFGSVESLPQGTILFERGDRTVDFFLVQEGHIEIFEARADGGVEVFTVHAEFQFTGELDLFNEREILVGGRMGIDGRVARLNRAQFRRLLAAEPDIAEIIMRAFILRRVGLIEHTQGAAILVGSREIGVADSLRLQRFLKRNGYPVRVMDVDAEEEARALLAGEGLSREDVPVAFCGRGSVLRRPSNMEMAQALGILEMLPQDKVFDVAVVGAGPAGLAAAVYAASEGLETVVLGAEAPGGQAGTSSKIENYLGFPTGISGQALAGRAQVQAQKFGARIGVPRTVVRLECDSRPYRLHLDDGTHVDARAVVVATGAHYRRLDGVENFERFDGGNGVHYAATAIEAGLCAGEEAVVVGGGNSAGQAAVFLSRHASHVHILVRGPNLAASMSDYLVGRISASDRITLHTQSEVVRLGGERHMDQVTWRNRVTGKELTRPVTNLFLMLGAVPNTEWLAGCGVRVDEGGFVQVGAQAGGSAADPLWRGREPTLFETSRPGIFAVGDVRAGSVKRVAASVGEGSAVVSAVHQVLAEG
ncbi:FAD-dependent oxidoreductase [Salinarimonas soli]|uniref:Thioredoxin reductase n=1 Tax=Salinarimonas soli TaxID=1638099 RepID=A0A5B2VIW2_9HYPH|nr:FAD-dependent oxidoreductase [Salinarimonas soli]KAA2238137.1 cyclic nucleotide-binding domain-containing protein [Salinarimonas soli]